MLSSLFFLCLSLLGFSPLFFPLPAPTHPRLSLSLSLSLIPVQHAIKTRFGARQSRPRRTSASGLLGGATAGRPRSAARPRTRRSPRRCGSLVASTPRGARGRGWTGKRRGSCWRSWPRRSAGCPPRGRKRGGCFRCREKEEGEELKLFRNNLTKKTSKGSLLSLYVVEGASCWDRGESARALPVGGGEEGGKKEEKRDDEEVEITLDNEKKKEHASSLLLSVGPHPFSLARRPAPGSLSCAAQPPAVSLSGSAQTDRERGKKFQESFPPNRPPPLFRRHR